MTDPAPHTQPAFVVRRPDPAPPTAPASVVHPSWGVNVEAEPAPVANGATAARHAAPDDVDYAEESGSGTRLGGTALVTVIAMFCVTLCVAIVSLFGDPRGGAVLAGLTVVIGVGLAYLFRDRWR